MSLWIRLNLFCPLTELPQNSPKTWAAAQVWGTWKDAEFTLFGNYFHVFSGIYGFFFKCLGPGEPRCGEALGGTEEVVSPSVWRGSFLLKPLVNMGFRALVWAVFVVFWLIWNDWGFILTLGESGPTLAFIWKKMISGGKDISFNHVYLTKSDLLCVKNELAEPL